MKSLIVIDAYEATTGVLLRLAEAIVILAVIYIIGILLYDVTGSGVNDTDVSAWNRSGLQVHLDAKTGVEYLSDGRGGLTVRLKKSELSEWPALPDEIEYR